MPSTGSPNCVRDRVTHKAAPQFRNRLRVALGAKPARAGETGELWER